MLNFKIGTNTTVLIFKPRTPSELIRTGVMVAYHSWTLDFIATDNFLEDVATSKLRGSTHGYSTWLRERFTTTNYFSIQYKPKMLLVPIRYLPNSLRSFDISTGDTIPQQNISLEMCMIQAIRCRDQEVYNRLEILARNPHLLNSAQNIQSFYDIIHPILTAEPIENAIL